MKFYENYSQAQGFNTETTLKLEDDGRFSYEESWKDYTNVSLYGGAEGRWRQDGGAVIFHTERVDGTLPHPWVVDQELRAGEQGDTLVFPDGFTLRVPPERKEDVPIHNTGRKPLTLVLEPWSTRHEVAPGERVRVVARGPGGMGCLEIVRGVDEIVVYGWSESRVAVVREPKPTQAVTTNRAPGAEAAKPTVKAPAAPPAPARVAAPEYPRFKPLTPSPELAALIRQWIDELLTEGMQNWLLRTCKELNALPLHSNLIYLWALRADGVVLCIDHEAFGHPTEPETDRLTVYAALAEGARTHPELGELIPPRPAGARECELCGGVGRTETPSAEGSTVCGRCRGLGWYVRVTCELCGGAGRTTLPGAGGSTACLRCSSRGWHVARTLS